MFAKRVAGEQPIDQPLVGVGARVGDELIDLGDGWREARQIERQPPRKDRTIRLRRRPQLLFFQAREQKAIDVVFRPSPIATAGSGGRTGFTYAQCGEKGAPCLNPAQ